MATNQRAVATEAVASMIDQTVASAERIAGQIEEIVEEANSQTERIVDINQAVDDLVADLGREAPADD